MKESIFTISCKMSDVQQKTVSVHLRLLVVIIVVACTMTAFSDANDNILGNSHRGIRGVPARHEESPQLLAGDEDDRYRISQTTNTSTIQIDEIRILQENEPLSSSPADSKQLRHIVERWCDEYGPHKFDW
jgi:hypothetical protein